MPAPTGLLFVDSFDHYTDLAGMQRKWTGAALRGFTTGRSGSGQALQIGATQGLPFLTFGWTYPTITVGVAYMTNSFNNSIIRLNCDGKSTGLEQWGDGRLFFLSNFVQTPPFDGFVMNLNTWYYFELKVTVTTNLFTYEVRVNNSTIASGTLAAATNALGTVGIQYIGAPGGGSFCTVDDLYVTDGDFLGDANWVCIYPDAPGDATTWTPNPAVANWINVSEHSPDDFTSYNQADAVANQDLYNMDDLGGTFKVVGAHALNCATKIAAGVASFKGSVKTNGGLVQESEFFPSFGSWQYQRVGYEINPVTGVAWTSADIDAIQRGALRIT
jgi:hypothetical protein